MLPFNSEASVFTGARTRGCIWINLVFLSSPFSLFQWLFHYFLVGKLIKYLQLKKFRAREIYPIVSGNTAIRALCWEVKYFHQNAIRYGRDINWVPAEHPVSSAAVLCGRSGHFSMYFCKGFTDCSKNTCEILPWRSDLWILLSSRCSTDKEQLYWKYCC